MLACDGKAYLSSAPLYSNFLLSNVFELYVGASLCSHAEVGTAEHHTTICATAINEAQTARSASARVLHHQQGLAGSVY